MFNSILVKSGQVRLSCLFFNLYRYSQEKETKQNKIQFFLTFVICRGSKSSVAVVFLGGEAAQLAVDAAAPVVLAVAALEAAGADGAAPAAAAQASAPARRRA